MELRDQQPMHSAFISTTVSTHHAQPAHQRLRTSSQHQYSVSGPLSARVNVRAPTTTTMAMPSPHQKPRQHNLKTMVRSHNVGLGAAEEFEMWIYARKQGSGLVCHAQSASSKSGDVYVDVEVEVIQPSCFVEQWENVAGTQSGMYFDGNRPQLPTETQSEVRAWTI